MSNFSVESLFDPDINPFDRQQRIEWWSQEKISEAKIMVVGAGAIGNETLKNLALLGAKNIFIADFDTISTSNLSRTVLFRQSDMGRKKAQVAAERTLELCLAENVKVNWFHGDIVWELGTGVYREMDIVLGCLDNVETRLEVNRQCWLAQTPWIDAGIYELGIHVSAFVPPTPPCYECSLNKEQRGAQRRRYSCDDFKRAMLQEGKMPTVQVASAIASAIQVQEAMKLVCNQQVAVGKKIYYQGKINDFDVNLLPVNHDCTTHYLSYPEVIALPYATNVPLRKFLEFVSSSDFSGEGATLDFSAYRTFVAWANCRSCGRRIDFFRPSFSIYDTETICKICQEKNVKVLDFDVTVETNKVIIPEFSLQQTEERVLSMSLRDLGVPYWPVVAVRDRQGGYKYYELSGDKEVLLPNVLSK